MKTPLTPADILRHAEQLGWPVTEARAGEIAASAKATYDHMARASAKLDFDVDTLSLFAVREECKETPAAASAGKGGERFTPPAISAPYPLHVTLTQAARALRERSVSSVELTQAAIAAAKALQSRVNAFVRIDEESALAVARACDADIAKGKVRGPLHGVPLAHKDMYYRKGLVSTCGSKIRGNWVAPVTASAAVRCTACRWRTRTCTTARASSRPAAARSAAIGWRR